ncbi:MAG: hypothetical protein ACMUIE_05450 [Thermoplasmatota archaeon]
MRRDLMIFSAALLLLLAPILSFPAAGEEEAPVESGEWESPDIEEVEVLLENASGSLKIKLEVRGTAPPGTESVNLTFAMQNESGLQVPDLWIDDSFSFYLPGMIEFVLEPQGEGQDEWVRWEFRFNLMVPMGFDMFSLLDLVGGSDFNISEEDIPLDSLEDIDMDTIMEQIASLKLFIIARAYNETGSWGQEGEDVTDMVITEVLSFMIDEGYIDSMPDDDDDGVSDDDDMNAGDDPEKKESPMLIGLAGGVIVILLIGIIIAVVFIIRTLNQNKG